MRRRARSSSPAPPTVWHGLVAISRTDCISSGFTWPSRSGGTAARTASISCARLRSASWSSISSSSMPMVNGGPLKLCSSMICGCGRAGRPARPRLLSVSASQQTRGCGGILMNSGYDGKLFILAFDHRGSFQKKWFGLEGTPSAEDTQRISDGKHLVFEGLLRALEQGAEAGIPGALVDEQFGTPTGIPAQAKERGLELAMPVEKSGQNEFDFEYGDQFGEHIEQQDPDFSKVLVRYNPDDPDTDMNQRQLARLKQLAGW